MVPNGWEVKKLDEICEINPKKPSEPDDTFVSFIPMSQVSEDGRIISKETKNYDEVSKGFTSFRDNDVLVAKITPCFENGKGALVNNLTNGIGFGSTEFHVLRAKKTSDSRFIFYLTRTSAFRARGTMNMQGSAGHRRVTTDFIKVYKVLTPPLPEQQKIAKILSTWDKAIDSTERLIDNSKQQKKALMQQLLTGKKRLLDDNGKPFEGEWEEFQLSDLALSGKNNFTDGDWVESVHIKDSGCRLIQTGNIGVGYFKNKNKKYISKDSFDELKCTEVHVGDLLICRLAEPAGRACIVPDIGESKMLTSVDVIIMRTDTTKALTKYLSYYFSLNHTLHRVSALCGGSTRSRVSRSVLGKMKLSLPDVQEQQKIAAVLTNADKEIELLEQQLADLQQEKKALMQVLLTGKKRVVVDGGTA